MMEKTEQFIANIHQTQCFQQLIPIETSSKTLAISVRFHSSTGLTYCFYMWCIFDNPDPIFKLQLVSLRKSCSS